MKDGDVVEFRFQTTSGGKAVQAGGLRGCWATVDLTKRGAA